MLQRGSARPHGSWQGTRFGLAFEKDFIKSNGGARVCYLNEGSIPSRALFKRIAQLMRTGAWDDELWKITPFIDRVMPGVDEWEWEREWRVPGGLRFSLSDVSFTMTPEGLVEGLEVGPPMFHPEYDTVWVDATPALLGDEIEDMVATFLQNCENPVNSLPVDNGEYVWIVDQWETDDAVFHLFEDLEESVFEAACDALNEISTERARRRARPRTAVGSWLSCARRAVFHPPREVIAGSLPMGVG